MKTRLITFLGMLLLVFSFMYPEFSYDKKKNRAILVNGGHTPSGDQSWDSLIVKALGKMKQTMKAWHDSTLISQTNDKDSLVKKLESLEGKLECGDTLTIVLVGHGGEETFFFTPQKDTLTASELLQHIDNLVDTVCCCRINVIISACHSGSWIEELLINDHVASVYTSADDDGVGWLDDSGQGWLDWFNHDLKLAADDSLGLGEALQKASESAQDSLPDQYRFSQNPEGYCRGSQEVVAHVEHAESSSDPSRRSVWVWVFQPQFSRGKMINIEIPDPKDKKLEWCDWIMFTGVYDGVEGPLKYSGGIKVLPKPPEITILGHVKGVDRAKNEITTHIVYPHWMYCQDRVLKVTPPGKISNDVDSCRWIKQKVTLEQPDILMEPSPAGGISTTQPVKAYAPLFSCTAHINSVDTVRQGGRFIKVKYLQPTPLREQVDSSSVWVPTNRAAEGVLDTCKTVQFVGYPYGNHFVAWSRIDTLGVNQASRVPPAPSPPKPEQEEPEEEKERSAFYFGMGLKPSYAFWRLRDFETSQVTYERYDAEEEWTASAEDFSGSLGYGAEIFGGLWLAPCHIVGLSVGYDIFPGGTFSQMYDDNAGYSSTVGVDLSTHTIPIEIFYKTKLGGTPLFIDVGGGIDFYRSTAHYDWRYRQDGVDGFLRGDLKDSGMGFHVSFGAEYFFQKNMAFFCKAGYGFAKFDHFTGSLTDQTGHRDNMLLTMVDEPGFGESLWTAPADEPLEANMRAAEVDFSGWRFSAGIQVFYNSPLNMFRGE